MVRLAHGVLLALEGIDGAGKTTQAAALASALIDVGLDVVSSKEPTNGPWGQRIRASAATGRMSAEDELHAFLEDRRAHVDELIRPSLARGAIVIVDRYYYSTAAYQGTRGFDPLQLITVSETFAPRPDLLVVIHVPVAIGLARIGARGDTANSFERADTLEQCARVFTALGGEHVLHVDGLGSPEEVTKAILTRLYSGALFKATCQKPYKEACEPEYCNLREQCSFPRLGSLVAEGDSDPVGPIDDFLHKVHAAISSDTHPNSRRRQS